MKLLWQDLYFWCCIMKCNLLKIIGRKDSFSDSCLKNSLNITCEQVAEKKTTSDPALFPRGQKKGCWPLCMKVRPDSTGEKRQQAGLWPSVQPHTVLQPQSWTCVNNTSLSPAGTNTHTSREARRLHSCHTVRFLFPRFPYNTEVRMFDQLTLVSLFLNNCHCFIHFVNLLSFFCTDTEFF